METFDLLSDDEIGLRDEVNDLDEITNGRRVTFMLEPDYAPDWGLKEAFRELYQNWRDGIIEEFDIEPGDFVPSIIEANHELRIEVKHHAIENLMGYIRVKFDKEGCGTLELTNFNASLQLRHLNIGASTKSEDDNQTGQHGEGMKLAALVFRREGYSFRIESSNFSWMFNFSPGRMLECNLTRFKTIPAALGPYRNDCSTNRSQDVCIMIGDKHGGRDRNGRKAKTKKVAIDEFRDWMKIVLDLNRPMSMMSTDAGDIILDEKHRGKVYLHGLLLPHGNNTGRPLRYGYNLLHGQTDRDRQTLSSRESLPRRFQAIWQSAMERHEDRAIVKYTELLLEPDTEFADGWVNAQLGLRLNKKSSTKIWHQMLKINHVDQQDGSRSAPFYYFADGKEDHAHIITEYLKKTPLSLRKGLWDVLSIYGLCRTPQKEQLHQLCKAQEAQIPTNGFSEHIAWMLECCLMAHSATDYMKLDFVEGGALGIDAAYNQRRWRVNNLWLSHERTHENVYCEQPEPCVDDPFACDHVVLELWDTMIAQLVASGNEVNVAKNQSWLKSMAHGRLAQMPRHIKCQKTERGGQLQVSWDCVDSLKSKNIPMCITLHASGCKRETVAEQRPVNLRLNRKDDDMRCDCPSQVVPFSASNVRFSGLDPNEKYTAKVSRDREGAFLGLAPTEASPLAEDIAELDGEGILGPTSRQSDATPRTTATITPGRRHFDTSNITANTIELSSDDDDCLYQEPTRASSETTGDRPPERAGDERTDRHSLQQGGRSTQSRVWRTNVRNGNGGGVYGVSTAGRDISASAREEESYIIGARIDHGQLGWDSGFPGSHDFYATKTSPNTYIVKPKSTSGDKRPLADTSDERHEKRPRYLPI